MDQLAVEMLPIARAAVVGGFVLLALLALKRSSRSGPTGGWLAAAFAATATFLLMDLAFDAADIEPPRWLDAVVLLLLVAFPYLLLRFTASFRALPGWLEAAAAAAAVAVGLATLALALPGGDLAGGSGIQTYLLVVLGYWVLVSLVTVVRLWRAGRGQPTVARRRMRSMSAATALLALALVSTQALSDLIFTDLMLQGALLVSAATFGVGFAPPRMLRRSWRTGEEEELQRGTLEVLRATTLEDVAAALLPPTVRIVGAAGAALVDADRCVVARHGQAPEIGTDLESGPQLSEVVRLGEQHGELVLWTTPYTPFFGREEVELLRAMAAVATLALDRIALLEVERSQRIGLEQARQEADVARQEAVSADLAKTEFLSRMSHELRTPLNAILGFGQLLEIAALADEDRESVDHILKAGNHLLALINDVLDLSRIEAGTLTISLEPVHVGELIADTIPLIRPMADARNIRLTVPNTDGCDFYVRTDRQRCRQVLLNLLSNAVKYNRDGGEVDVHCVQVRERSLRTSVRDTGRGIDPARQQLLFQPFERLGAEGSGVEGTGLGLALTKQLAERLGGTIGVESTPGQGSTFWIDLPITDQPSDPDDTIAPVPATAPVSDHTLLLVEDNLANLHLVEAFLRRRPNITILPAMQGTLALELAHEHRPDAIVLDLHLPDISGREVLTRLQADPLTRDIPVVIASADASPGRIRQLRDDGAFDYITKPLDLHRFLELVDRALGHRVRTPGAP